MYSPAFPPPLAGEFTLKLLGLDRVKVRPYVGIPGNYVRHQNVPFLRILGDTGLFVGFLEILYTFEISLFT